MPTSTYSHIGTVCRFLIETRPESFLDVGLGNGKMGFIARDLLDVMLGERYHRRDWKVKLDGIEVFEDYIQDHQKAIYDEIFIGNAIEVIDKLGQYDMVYIGDVLEHFEKSDGWTMLDKIAAHSKKHMIVSLPLGEKWTQPPIYGNPYEEHKSFWSADEFEPFSSANELLDFPGIGPYGTFLIERDNYIHHRARELATALLDAGRGEDALDLLVGTVKNLPADLMTEYVVVDMLLNLKRIKDAEDRLTAASDIFPDEAIIKEHLEKLRSLPRTN